MTESDWLKAKDPEAMLRLVAHRLSARQWHLLACAVVRRAGDLLPDGPLRAAVEWAERHAGTDPARDPLARDLLFRALRAADPAAEAARAAERLVVRAADPDADPDAYRHADARKTNPSAPLFQAACRNARDAVRLAGEAAGHAAEAASALVQLRPGPGLLDRARDVVVTAARARAEAALHANAALKLKALGDDAADRDTGRNVRHRYAACLDAVRREEEFAGYQHGNLAGSRERADRKALGRLLHEVVGNPFRPYTFDPAWRTDTVVGLARGIDADRGFDRMPVLADALLDADCDDEAILRHCRGTEPHAPDAPHCRGCWVVDLILGREEEFFAAPPVPSGRLARLTR